MLGSKGFDLWADGYDKSVSLSEKANEYPFAGYKRALGTIYNTVKSGSGRSILDIGFGTGILSKKLYDDGCSIYGVDFLQHMVDIAKQRIPQAMLVQHDFAQGLSVFPSNQTFDYVICTYAIHHLNDSQKVELIQEALDYLSASGQVLIGDVAFETIEEMEQCKMQSGNRWDADEFYPIVEVLQPVFPLMRFEKISFCAGVLQNEFGTGSRSKTANGWRKNCSRRWEHDETQKIVFLFYLCN